MDADGGIEYPGLDREWNWIGPDPAHGPGGVQRFIDVHRLSSCQKLALVGRASSRSAERRPSISANSRCCSGVQSANRASSCCRPAARNRLEMTAPSGVTTGTPGSEGNLGKQQPLFPKRLQGQP